MINEFAQEFWRQRAESTDASIRWTDQRMLDVDVSLLVGVVPQGASLLDLGCGTGDVFLAILDRLSRVTAVDMIPDFLDRIPSDPRITTVASEVASFASADTFDVGIMFGVVTHLTLEQERGAYEALRAAVPHGTVVVKNQCGRDADLDVDRWSEAFSSRYIGRYPHVDAQAARLREVFGEVEVVPYPAEVNQWADSLHVAFVCRGPRPETGSA